MWIEVKQNHPNQLKHIEQGASIHFLFYSELNINNNKAQYTIIDNEVHNVVPVVWMVFFF